MQTIDQEQREFHGRDINDHKDLNDDYENDLIFSDVLRQSSSHEYIEKFLQEEGTLQSNDNIQILEMEQRSRELSEEEFKGQTPTRIEQNMKFKEEEMDRQIKSMEFESLKLQSQLNQRIQELEKYNSQTKLQEDSIDNTTESYQNTRSDPNTQELDNPEQPYKGQHQDHVKLECEVQMNRASNTESKANNSRQINNVTKPPIKKEKPGSFIKPMPSNRMTPRYQSNRNSLIPKPFGISSPSPRNHGRNSSAQRFSTVLYVGQRKTSGYMLNNMNLETINDPMELKQLIAKMSMDKELLEQEISNIKDKAISQIIAKEKQIIELIKYNENQQETLKKENARLQQEVQGLQKSDRQRDDLDNKLIIKLERTSNELQEELILYEERYTKLHQKYLEDRRQLESEIAILHDKNQKDCSYYQSKVDKQKERVRLVLEDNDRLKGKLLQTQDFREEIINDLEEQEQRLRDAENDKNQIEKEFMFKIELKNEIIKEKQERILELQDQLFNFENNLKKALAKQKAEYERKINEMRDQLTQKDRKYIEIEIEIENLKDLNTQYQSQIKELNQKKSMLNEILQEIQEQKRVIQENYEQKIEALELQMEQNSRIYQQQLSSLKIQNKMMGDNEKDFKLNSLKELDEEYLETDGDLDLQENYYKTESTQNTHDNCQTPKKSGSNFTSAQKPLALTLMDELNEDQMNYQRLSVYSNNFFMRDQRASHISNHRMMGMYSPYHQSPRCSLLQNEQQFMKYQASPMASPPRNPSQIMIQGIQSARGSQQFKLELKKPEYSDESLKEEVETLKQEKEQLQLQLNEKDEELEEFEEQLAAQQEEIKTLLQAKEVMAKEFQVQLEQFQIHMRSIYQELQDLKKKKFMEQQQMNKELVRNQTIMQTDLMQLRRKLRRVQNENEDLSEQIMSQKQQYSSEVNQLKIQLTTLEEQIMQYRLKEAHLNNEKDFLTMKLAQYKKQAEKLKEEVEGLNKELRYSPTTFMNSISQKALSRVTSRGASEMNLNMTYNHGRHDQTDLIKSFQGTYANPNASFNYGSQNLDNSFNSSTTRKSIQMKLFEDKIQLGLDRSYRQ